MKALHQDLWLGGHGLKELGDPVDLLDAVNLQYLEGLLFPLVKSLTIQSPVAANIPIFYCHRNIKVLSVVIGITQSAISPSIDVKLRKASDLMGSITDIESAHTVTTGTANSFTINAPVDSGNYLIANFANITNIDMVHVTVLYTYKVVAPQSILFGGPAFDMFFEYNKETNQTSMFDIEGGLSLIPVLETNGILFDIEGGLDFAPTVEKFGAVSFDMSADIVGLGEKAKNQIEFGADIDLTVAPSQTNNGRLLLSADLDLVLIPERLTSGDLMLDLSGLDLTVSPYNDAIGKITFAPDIDLTVAPSVEKYAKIDFGISCSLLPPPGTL